MEGQETEKLVLLATSDHLLAERYRIALTQKAYRVREAFDGDEALEYAQAENPDVLILDAKLEKRDGFSVLETLRQEPVFRSVPAFMITDTGSPAERSRAESIGGAQIVIKSLHSEFDVVDMATAALGGEVAKKPLSTSSAPVEATLGHKPDVDSDHLLGSDVEADEHKATANSSSDETSESNTGSTNELTS